MALPHKPGVMLIHLLNTCNLKCKYCYMESALDKIARLPLEIVVRTIREAEMLGIKGMWLSEGEPFLYPELSKVLDCAAKMESLDVTISTNGTLIGKKTGRDAKEP